MAMNIGDTIMQMQRVEHSLDRLDEKAKKATRSARDLHKELGKPFNKQVAEGGQRIASASGPMGSVLGRVMGGFGIDGAVGRAAVGFGVLSVAVGAAARVAEVAADRTQKLIEAESQLADAREKSDKALDAQAREGANQRQAIAQLHLFGGQNAVDAADAFATRHGQKTADVQAAAGLAYRSLDGDAIDNAMRAALEAVRGGLAGSMQEAMQTITSDRHIGAMLKGRSLGQDNGDLTKVDDALAWMYRQPGRPVDRELGKRIRASRRTDDDATDFLEAADRMTGIDSQQDRVKRQRTTERGEQTAREDLARTVSPESAELVKVGQQMQKAVDQLQRLADSQNTVARVLADLTSPQGSFETQKRRLQTAQGSAVLSSPNAGD
jgi:hypothetical protein